MSSNCDSCLKTSTWYQNAGKYYSPGRVTSHQSQALSRSVLTTEYIRLWRPNLFWQQKGCSMLVAKLFILAEHAQRLNYKL